MEAVHNSAYWSHKPYSGFGPGAHSFLARECRPVRKWNLPDLKAYLKAAGDGSFESVTESEILTPEQVAIEKMMLSLRTDKGIAEEYLYSHANGDKVRELISCGHLAMTSDGHVRIPEDCFFISDSIIAEII